MKQVISSVKIEQDLDRVFKQADDLGSLYIKKGQSFYRLQKSGRGSTDSKIKQYIRGYQSIPESSKGSDGLLELAKNVLQHEEWE